MEYIKRSATEIEIEKLLKEKKRTASLCFLRGRRRIGKSTLLQQKHSTSTSCFYFSGVLDENTTNTYKRWVKEWEIFSKETPLSKIATRFLDWKIILLDICRHAQNNKSNFGIFVDEIQWLSKSQSGMIGIFKEVWPQLEKFSNIKIILCGSSNKFFNNFTGGEEKILRGLTTHRNIIPPPLTISQIKENITQHWTLEENVLAYMFMGGVPYYWMQTPQDRSFFQSINAMFFSPSTIFLDEYYEILNLEFNKQGIKTVSKILEVIGIHGAQISSIVERSRLPLSTVIETVANLVKYNILYPKNKLQNRQLQNNNGTIYIIHDHYLLFFFSVLKKHRRSILNNTSNELIFKNIIHSKNGLYIENFTGKAFENLIKQILLKETNRTEQIFLDLDIHNCDYEISEFLSEDVQIDIVIHNSPDRCTRFIECKWTHDPKLISKEITNFKEKVEIVFRNYKTQLESNCTQYSNDSKSKNSINQSKMFIITNCPMNKQLQQQAQISNVKILTLESLKDY